VSCIILCLGGPSTKLCFQSLNRADVNSVSHLIPLALYEGIGEDYDMLSHIFKPMFDQLHKFTQSFNLQPPDPAKTQHSLYLQENEIQQKLFAYKGHIQLNSSNMFISPSCSICEQLCSQHGLQPTPLHSPITLDSIRQAQLIIAADMPMLRMLIGCQTSAKCHNFCPMCLVNRYDVEENKVHAPIVLDDYKAHGSHSRPAYPLRTIALQHQLYQSFITNGHGNIDDAKYYGNVIHEPLISSEICYRLAALPLHILLGTTKKAMDILTTMCA
jgi:hypothetical protein